MTNLKTIAAVSAAMAVIACGSLAFAQDDLDDLLADLEGGGDAAVAEAPAEEPAEAEEPAAEEPAEEPAEA